MLTQDLLNYLFDGSPHPLDRTVQGWIEHSRRYRGFVTTFRDKIRKKLRTTPDPDNLVDLRIELETAYLLLQERTLQVIYEPLPPRQQRSPDFAVTYTTSLTFMLEVTRLRAAGPISDEEKSALSPLHERLADVVGNKLGQLVTGEYNILLLAVDAELFPFVDLNAAMRTLQQRAEQQDAAFLQRYNFRSRAEFFRQYQQLTEIVVRTTEGITGAPHSWVNGQTRQSLPSKVRTTLHRSHTILAVAIK